MYQNLAKRIWLTIIILILEESFALLEIWFSFVKVSFILSRLELSRAEFPKLTPSVLMENCDHAFYPGLSVVFLHVPTHRARLFEKLILELEGPSCSLKSLIFTSRPGWSRTNNPFVWLSPGEKKIGTTSYSLSGVFDNGWYEFRLKYWCPCFVFCKIQVLDFASKDPDTTNVGIYCAAISNEKNKS